MKATLRNKSFMLIVALTVIFCFGTVGSADAFVDPVTAVVLTGIGLMAFTAIIVKSTQGDDSGHNASAGDLKRSESKSRPGEPGPG